MAVFIPVSRKVPLLLGALLLTLSVALPGCKKGKDADAKPVDKSTFLTQSGRKWRITAYTTQAAGAALYDTYAHYAPCDKDNFVVFRPDQSLVADNGALHCPGEDPPTTQTWSLSSDARKLTLTAPASSGGDSVVIQVLELTPTTLRIQFVKVAVLTPSVTHAITFSSF